MKKVWSLFCLVILLTVFIIYLYLKTVLVQFTVQNGIPGYNFRISSLAGNLFLYIQDYKTYIKKINVIFTQETQDAVRLTLLDQKNPTSSMNARIELNSLSIWEQYTQDALVSALGGTEVKNYKIDLDEDLYAYLCITLDPAKPGRDACYQKASDYVQSLGKFPIFNIVKSAKKTAFRLVNRVFAACSGAIPCGGSNTGYHCINTGLDCPCGAGDTCEWGTWCDTRLNNLDCSVVSNQSSCQTAGISQCAVSCNTSGDTFCTWGGTATPPPGGGGCTCNCMSATSPSCDDSRVGLWNIAFKTGGGNTTPVGESYIATVPNYLPSGLNICAKAGSISRVVSFFRPHPKKILYNLTILRRGL